MNCPECGQPLQASERRQLWVCPNADCGYTTPLTSDASRLLDLSRLPSILAIPLKEFAEETHPVIKLWQACDTVELALRLAVSIGLAQARRDGLLSDALVNELREHIEDPTLGRWKRMAQVLAEHLSGKLTIAPELPRFVSDVLAPLLDAPKGAEPTAENSFSAMRNQLAHGGGVTKAAGAKLLGVWRERFEQAMAQAAWLANLAFVTRLPGGGLGILRGPVATASPYQPESADAAAALPSAFAQGEEVVVVRGRELLPLWPLALYGLPRHPDPDAQAPRRDVLQVYVRRGIQLQFTPLGSDEVCQSVGDEAGLEAFRKLLRLDEAPKKGRAAEFKVRGFEADIRKDARSVVGRERELEELRRVIAATPQGVLWLTGPAGIGKSYLLAKATAELLDEPPPDTLVVPFRFRGNDDRCSRETFMRFAMERLHAWLAPGEKLDDGGERQGGEERKLVERLRHWLGRLNGKRALMVLDGMDELAARDTAFAREAVLALPVAGVTWLCAGRTEHGLGDVFTPDNCRAVSFGPEPGVPPMDKAGVRAMLLAKVGPLRKRLLAGDKDQGDAIVNPFIDRVTENAEGLPLYVTYVIGDILNGRFRALDAGERLPPSLETYYEEMLRRLAVGVLHQVLTPLAATLAVARAPLSVAMLSEILTRRTVIASGEDGGALVRRGLTAIASMLRAATTPEGAESYTLYHQSLKDHMERSAETRGALQSAREHLCQLAPGWQATGEAVQGYLVRHGVRHMLELERWQDAAKLLGDMSFLDLMWDADEYEVRASWVQVEEHSSCRMVDAYKPVLDQPAEHQEHLRALGLLLYETGHLTESLPLQEWRAAHYRAMGDKSSLRWALGSAALILQDRGNLDGAMALYQEVEQVCRELGDEEWLQKSLSNQAGILYRRGQLDVALTRFQDAERICRESEDKDGLHGALNNHALILRDRGNLAGALALLKEAERICRELGDKDGLQISLNNQALVLQDRCDLDGALALLREAEQICRQLGNPHGLQRILGNQALILSDRGDLNGAMALHKEAERSCRQLGDLDGLQSILNNQALILKARGDLDGAMALHKESDRICRQLGNLDSLQVTLGNQALILADRGDPDGAMALHKEEEGICRQLGNLDGLARTLGNQGVILHDRGDLDGAMELYKEAERICRQLGSLEGLQRALGHQANILSDRGDLDGAMALHKEEERIYRQLGNPDGLQRTFGNQALILADRGDLDGAMALHKEAERTCRQLGNLDGLARTLGNQASILKARGDLDGATALLKQQERICRQLGNLNHLEGTLGIQANILHERNDLDGAMMLYKESERICREMGNKDGLQATLGNQALILYDRGDLDEAMALHKEQERICREIGNKTGLATSLGNQGLVLHDRGDLDGAMALQRAAEKIRRELGNKSGLAASLANEALILHARHDLDGAVELLKEAGQLFGELGDKHGLARSLGQRASILQDCRDLDGAMALHKEAESIYRELGDKDGWATSLGDQALLSWDLGDLNGAMRLHKEEERLWRELGNPESLAISLVNQAELLSVKLSRPQEALPLAEEAHRLATEHGYAQLADQTGKILAAIRAKLGVADE